jgi:hypothetical protein
VARKRKKAAPALDDSEGVDIPAEKLVAKWAAELREWTKRERAGDVKKVGAVRAQEIVDAARGGDRAAADDLFGLPGDEDLGTEIFESCAARLGDKVKYIKRLFRALEVHQFAAGLLFGSSPDAYARVQRRLKELGLEYPPPIFTPWGNDDPYIPSIDEVLLDILTDASFVGRFAQKPDLVRDAAMAEVRAEKMADSEALATAIEDCLRSALASWEREHPGAKPFSKTIIADICSHLKKSENKRLHVRESAVRKRLRSTHPKLFADG